MKMLKEAFNKRNSEERKIINGAIDPKVRLITATKAILIAVLVSSVFHAININMMIIMVLYKTPLLILVLFSFVLAIVLTLAYAEDVYYNILEKNGLNTKEFDIKKLRKSGFILNLTLGVVLSLILSIITYVIIINM